MATRITRLRVLAWGHLWAAGRRLDRYAAARMRAASDHLRHQLSEDA